MRKFQYYTSILLFIVINSTALAQTISWNTNDNFEYISNVSKQGFTLKLQINRINFKSIKTEYGNFYSADISGFGKSLDYGNPALPVYKKLMELPDGAKYEIEIIKKKIRKINLSNYGINDYIFPAQLPIPKVENPDVKFQFNKNTYAGNISYSLNLVEIVPLGKLRSTSLARIEISPISYNPKKNQIEVVEELTLNVHINSYNYEALKNDKRSHYSPFYQSLDNILINSKAYKIPTSTKVAANKFPIKYVIVADSMFKQSLQPFIRWKEKEGYKIIEAYTQDTTVGNTTSSIKAYLQGLYNAGSTNDPAPTFVLFVGDIAQIPSFYNQTNTHVTDLYYCEFTGDDFPEMMYGRFSATDTAELNAQINKTIEYETYSMPDPSYLETSVLIAGYDASHGPTYGDGQINYGTNYYFNSSNSTNCKNYLYANGSYNKDSEIRQQIDSGVSIANYTAHGSPLGWADPSFNVSHVANMTNQSKYPLMLGNACLTNKFNTSVCFGEALLRAKNKGAIGYIGASDNTLWDEDFYWAVGYGSISSNPTYNGTTSGLYDLIFHTHNEAYSNWAMNSYQYMMAGNLAVTQGGSSINYYWEVYNLMGDPSLMAYLRVPDPINASFVPFIQSGWTTYSVTTVPYALVALSHNDTLISSAVADSTGLAVLELGSFNYVGTFNLTITAQNHAPYFATVFGGAPSGPYVISTNIILNDSITNNNSVAEFGETVKFDMDFVNLTQYISNNTIAVLQIYDNQVIINDSTLTLGDITGFDTITTNGVFDVSIINNAIDKHIVNGKIKITDSVGTNWYSNVSFSLYAPNIEILNSVFDDQTYGNNNGIIEPGEHIIFKIKLNNIGRRDALGLICNFVNPTNDAVVNNNFTLDTLHANSTVWATFDVVFNSNASDLSIVPFTFDFTSGAYTGQKNFPQFVGVVDEDFETGDFSKFVWKSINNLNWTVDTMFKYEGQYSARSSANIVNDSISTIYVSMNVIADDSISFYRKVSSEESYDKLHFYIDGNEMGSWSGNKNWERFSFPINSGMHTLKWSYSKDGYVSSYMDAAWIDNIIFPPTDAWSSIDNSVKTYANNINLWPNPATEIVNIDFELNKNSNVSTSIVNQLGQLVVNKVNHGEFYQGDNSIPLNISNLSSGVYIVKIDIDKQVYFQKLIIK